MLSEISQTPSKHTKFNRRHSPFPSLQLAMPLNTHRGHAAGGPIEALYYKPEGRGFDSRWCHWNFLLMQSFRPHCGPGVDSASNRNRATSSKVAGSIADSVTGIFHLYNPSGRTVALGSTQSLTEMRARDIPWGKGGRCVRLTTLPPSCAVCIEIWEPQPDGTLRACPGVE